MKKSSKKNNNNGGGVSKALIGLGAFAVGAVATFGAMVFADSNKPKEKVNSQDQQRQQQQQQQIRNQARKIKEQEQIIQQNQENKSPEPPLFQDMNNDNLKCPISLNIMDDPHFLTTCGHTFQKDEIVQWVRNHNSCPICKTETNINSIKPNFALKNYINEMKQKK